MDRQLRLLKEKVLPPDNNAPPSLYLLRGLLGVPDPSDFEKHVCLSDKCKFADRARSTWAQFKDEVCACGHRRFEMKVTRSGAVPVPKKVGTRV